MKCYRGTCILWGKVSTIELQKQVNEKQKLADNGQSCASVVKDVPLNYSCRLRVRLLKFAILKSIQLKTQQLLTPRSRLCVSASTQMTLIPHQIRCPPEHPLLLTAQACARGCCASSPWSAGAFHSSTPCAKSRSRTSLRHCVCLGSCHAETLARPSASWTTS